MAKEQNYKINFELAPEELDYLNYKYRKIHAAQIDLIAFVAEDPDFKVNMRRKDNTLYFIIRRNKKLN